MNKQMRFEALDGWRGICAIMVALYHLRFDTHFQSWTFIRNSNLFVDFFFVLSGFVICHSYGRRLSSMKELGVFLIRRFGRLWPLHIFTLLVLITVETSEFVFLAALGKSSNFTTFGPSYSIDSLFANLFFLQGVGIYDRLTWNSPSWSICVEFWTYFIFALTTLAIGRVPFRVAALYALIAGGILTIYSEKYLLATYDLGLIRCILGFFVGVITYQLFTNRQLFRYTGKPLATVFECFLIAGVVAYVIFFGRGHSTLFAPFLFAVVVFSFASERGGLSALLKAPPIQKIGAWSYSIYMVHMVIIVIIDRAAQLVSQLFKLNLKIPAEFSPDQSALGKTLLRFFENTYANDLLGLTYIAVVLVCSALTFRFVETPGAKYFKKVECAIFSATPPQKEVHVHGKS